MQVFVHEKLPRKKQPQKPSVWERERLERKSYAIVHDSIVHIEEEVAEATCVAFRNVCDLREGANQASHVSGGVDPRNYGGEVRIPGEAGWRRPRPVLGARLERRIGGQRFRWQRFGLVPMCMA